MIRDDRILKWTPIPSDNRRWTATDIERLGELADANISKFVIASTLNRTSNAVEMQARKHGIKLQRVKRSHYLTTIKSR
jgi:hypothetical protein